MDIDSLLNDRVSLYPVHSIDEPMVDKILSHCDFTKGAYIIQAHARRKLNDGLTHNREIMFREVLTKGNKKYIQKKLDILMKKVSKVPEYKFYFYVSLAPKNIKLAYKILAQRIIQWVYDYYYGAKDPKNTAKKCLKHLKSEYKTAVAQKEASITSNRIFMIDIDTKDVEVITDVENTIRSLAQGTIDTKMKKMKDAESKGKKIKKSKSITTNVSDWIIAGYETNNGYHLITHTFDRSKLNIKNVEVKDMHHMLFIGKNF